MESSDLIGLGADPALDFLNSTATPVRDTVELIGDGRAYLSWLEQTGLIDTTDSAVILDLFETAELDTVAAQAVGLREWLRPVVAAWTSTSDGKLPASAGKRLNDILRSDHRYEQLHQTSAGRAYQLHEHRRWHDASQLLAPPAEAVARLLTTADRQLVRHCEGPGCTLWFYDRTKSHSRRWCSMAVCGNRAKARNHRGRDRASTS